MMKIRNFLQFQLAIFLSACSGAPPAGETVEAAASGGATGPATYVYACPGGERFLARIQTDSAIVEAPPRVYRLPQVISASGARYAAGEIEFWTKGHEARLAANGVHMECTGTRADTPWDAARLMGFEFRAIGQEPGWVLDIDQDGHVSYAGDYGETRFVARLPEPVQDSAGDITYRVNADGHGLTVTIRETSCEDVMSGEAFSHTVSLIVDGRPLHGCGRAL